MPALEIAELILGSPSFEKRLGRPAEDRLSRRHGEVVDDFVTVAMWRRSGRMPPGQPFSNRTFLNDDEAVPIRADLVGLERCVGAVQQCLLVVQGRDVTAVCFLPV